MSNRSLILSLARVIIAAAWADGEVTREEINSLKDLLYQLPRAGFDGGLQLSGREWSRLEMYIETPISAAERQRLIADLQYELRSTRDKQLVRDALDQLVHIDGDATPEEEALIEEVKAAIADVDVSLFGNLGRLVGGAVSRRTAAADAPNRERYFDDFIKNKVYYAVVQRLREEGRRLELAERDLRRLSLTGGLLARVAHVDEEVVPGEMEVMTAALQAHMEVDAETAVFVSEVAISPAAHNLDLIRTARQYATATEHREERLHLLDLLFAVAIADGYATQEEIEEIRAISKSLQLTHKEFIDAKLKIPREKREN
jgi:uncharacterized tellurite resistance protein B-like protein